MTLPVTRTVNTTSFALCYMDATALILDGISLGDASRRKEKFEQAKGRVKKALLYAELPEEKALARQLISYLQIAEMKRWDV